MLALACVYHSSKSDNLQTDILEVNQKCFVAVLQRCKRSRTGVCLLVKCILKYSVFALWAFCTTENRCSIK